MFKVVHIAKNQLYDVPEDKFFLNERAADRYLLSTKGNNYYWAQKIKIKIEDE